MLAKFVKEFVARLLMLPKTQTLNPARPYEPLLGIAWMQQQKKVDPVKLLLFDKSKVKRTLPRGRYHNRALTWCEGGSPGNESSDSEHEPTELHYKTTNDYSYAMAKKRG